MVTFRTALKRYRRGSDEGSAEDFRRALGVICCNCGEFPEAHLSMKCLFGPTTYRPGGRSAQMRYDKFLKKCNLRKQGDTNYEDELWDEAVRRR